MIDGSAEYYHPVCEINWDGTTVNILINRNNHFWPEDIKSLRKLLKKVEKQLERDTAAAGL